MRKFADNQDCFYAESRQSTASRCFKSNELFSMDAMPSASFCATLLALHKTSLQASAS
jgi:hypothetical protein